MWLVSCGGRGQDVYPHGLQTGTLGETQQRFKIEQGFGLGLSLGCPAYSVQKVDI